MYPRVHPKEPQEAGCPTRSTCGEATRGGNVPKKAKLWLAYSRRYTKSPPSNIITDHHPSPHRPAQPRKRAPPHGAPPSLLPPTSARAGEDTTVAGDGARDDEAEASGARLAPAPEPSPFLPRIVLGVSLAGICRMAGTRSVSPGKFGAPLRYEGGRSRSQGWMLGGEELTHRLIGTRLGRLQSRGGRGRGLAGHGGFGGGLVGRHVCGYHVGVGDLTKYESIMYFY